LTDPWDVYIGRLHDGRFYVGISQLSPARLLSDHRSGDHSRFTRVERLVAIEWTERHPTLSEAKARERQLKGWSHAKKQALIDGDVARLKLLSRSKGR